MATEPPPECQRPANGQADRAWIVVVAARRFDTSCAVGRQPGLGPHQPRRRHVRGRPWSHTAGQQPRRRSGRLWWRCVPLPLPSALTVRPVSGRWKVEAANWPSVATRPRRQPTRWPSGRRSRGYGPAASSLVSVKYRRCSRSTTELVQTSASPTFSSTAWPAPLANPRESWDAPRLNRLLAAEIGIAKAPRFGVSMV